MCSQPEGPALLPVVPPDAALRHPLSSTWGALAQAGGPSFQGRVPREEVAMGSLGADGALQCHMAGA